MSFFFYNMRFPFYELKNEDDFDQFFQLFAEGRVNFGDYFEMVPKRWRMSEEKIKILFLLLKISNLILRDENV